MTCAVCKLDKNEQQKYGPVLNTPLPCKECFDRALAAWKAADPGPCYAYRKKRKK
jgi:hypothetical protein